MLSLLCRYEYLDGLVQECGISSADALEIPQSCPEPSNFILSVVRAKLTMQDLFKQTSHRKIIHKSPIFWRTGELEL